MKVAKKPELNIGMIGHVDHGKTTLTQALTGKWTDTFSEELRRGISIKLGYANFCIFREKNKPEPECYNTEGKGEFLRCISIVDAPGHEALMAVLLSASAIMDGAILVIAANEGIRPQTREHAMAVQIAGIKNIVVVQNKIDTVTKEQALKNKEEIEAFLSEYSIEAPIIPASALHKVNIDLILEALEKFIPTPKRNPKAEPKFLVVRSFDVNKPGKVEELVGGVLGGSLVRGVLRVGDEIEIRPGPKELGYEPITTEIVSLATEGGLKLEKATPGGSIAIGTKLDPSLTKRDKLMGRVVGLPGKMPPMYREADLEVTLFDRVVGIDEDIKVEPLKAGERLIVSVNSVLSAALVTEAGKEHAHLKFAVPIVAEESDRIVISRKIKDTWRLVGYAKLR